MFHENNYVTSLISSIPFFVVIASVELVIKNSAECAVIITFISLCSEIQYLYKTETEFRSIKYNSETHPEGSSEHFEFMFSCNSCAFSFYS